MLPRPARAQRHTGLFRTERSFPRPLPSGLIGSSPCRGGRPRGAKAPVAPNEAERGATAAQQRFQLSINTELFYDKVIVEAAHGRPGQLGVRRT